MGMPLDILGCGMVTGVGFSAPASCAAIRVGIDGFVETRFMFDGEWLIGCPVPFEEGWRGRERLVQMVVPAIAEALDGGGAGDPEHTALLLCLAERERVGRLEELDHSMLEAINERLGMSFHASSAVIEAGRVGGVEALAMARKLFSGHSVDRCVVAGVDSLLVVQTLTWLHKKRRILTADNSDGFIPGEAAGAVLVAPSKAASSEQFRCLGLGFGKEPAPLDSGKPLRADGAVEAIRSALSDAKITFEQIDYRIADISGLQYGFKEAALAAGRVLRPTRPGFDLWNPASSIGEVGAASVPVAIAVGEAAEIKGYGPGRGTLCHFSSEGATRAALVLSSHLHGLGQ